MCLIDNKKFRFTFKPIKVYKVVTTNNKAPYFHSKLKKINFSLYGLPKNYVFTKGFYHACLTKEKAKEIFNLCKTVLPEENYKIITGYIPLFTRYAKDLYGNICSRILILNL